MMSIVKKRVGQCFMAACLCLAVSLPAFSQDRPDAPPPQPAPALRDRPYAPPPPMDEDARFHHHRLQFEPDDRGNVEGKRASCEVYARVAQVQIDANREYHCGLGGVAWDPNVEAHFRWCRYARRETVAEATRARFADLQRCFDRLGDFDDDSLDRPR